MKATHAVKNFKIDRRVALGFATTIVTLMAQTLLLSAQEVATNPNRLEPVSIFDGFTVDLPNYVTDLIEEKDMEWNVYDLKQGTRYVFRETDRCHSSGCTIVLLSYKDGVFFDPIIFVSDDANWYRDVYSNREEPIGDVCVTQNVAFDC